MNRRKNIMLEISIKYAMKKRLNKNELAALSSLVRLSGQVLNFNEE